MASGPRGNVKLIYCHGLESCKFSVPVCNVSVMETNVSDKCLVSAKLWIFWILSWSLNVLVIVIAVSGEILAAQWSYS